jgi:FkbH-like protein
MIEEIKIFNKAINSFLDNSIRPKQSRLKKVFFLRNEQVENFVEKINNYSVLSKLRFNFFFSEYDNDLPIIKKKYDIGIIWLDYTYYKINNEFFDWINSKADELSNFVNYVLIKPILIPNLKSAEIVRLNNSYKKIFKNDKVIFLDIIDEFLENNKNFWDLERSDFFGTKTSIYGQNLQAKLLGLKVFPSLFNQKIKSIIFDLDDTLYTGTVGEDGLNQIYLDKNQKKAEIIYSSLQKNGTLLSICSKNNEKDVKEVFKKKKLEEKLFFPIKANWETKSKNIYEIQKNLKISFHNILFIDNNISELIEVKKRIPDINIFWSNNSTSLINCLKYYPNLTDYFNPNLDRITSTRIGDLKASIKRDKILRNSINKNYFSILKMKIEFRLNNKKEFNRIFSLVNKVNQFIFTYKRFSKNKIKEYINHPNKYVFTIALKDRFSDSGNIGVIFFTKIDSVIYIDELCISCRALGRNLEDYFIFYPLQILSKRVKFESIVIKFVNGLKNKPAKKYFRNLKKKIFKKVLTKNQLKISFSTIEKILKNNKYISLNFKN